jgi:hypothetical protein
LHYGLVATELLQNPAKEPCFPNIEKRGKT